MQFFEYSHLPEPLRSISGQVCDLAHKLDEMLPDGPEKEAGMRKLLEAKDCFVRSHLQKLKLD
jgi:hypothetical protein